MRNVLFFFAIVLASAGSTAAKPDAGIGEYRPERHSPLKAVHARPLFELGDAVIRFSSSPALGGPATVVEVRPDKDDFYRVTVSYLSGHPASGWDRQGSFHFWISANDFHWLLGEVETAEKELGGSESGQVDEDGDGVRDAIIVCTDGPGYLTEIRSSRRTRWVSGFCGQNANNSIAPLMARLVHFGTSRYLTNMDDGNPILLREGDVTP